MVKDKIQMYGEVCGSTKFFLDRYGISDNTWHTWRKSGKIPAGYKIGKSFYFPIREVEQMLGNRTGDDLRR